MNQNTLPQINYHGNDWLQTKQELTRVMESLQRSILDSSKDWASTNFIRGQIYTIRQILNWETLARERQNGL